VEKRELSNCTEAHRHIFALKCPLRSPTSDSTKQTEEKNI